MDNKMITILTSGGVALGLGLLAYRSFQNSSTKITNNAQKKKNQEDTYESHICQHDGKGLVELSPGTLWHVTVEFHGNGPPWRRMIVYRPSKTQSLILLSPSAVTLDVMKAIESLGMVDYLIIPNSYHRTDAAVFKARYPKAKVACPPGWVRKGVSEVVPVDMDARELANLFPDQIKVIRIGGLCDPKEAEGDFEYAYEFKCAPSSLDETAETSWAYAVTDTLFNMPNQGFMTWLFGSGGIEHDAESSSSSDGCQITTTRRRRTPRVGTLSKWFMHSRADCANFYRNIAERKDIRMILVAHGDNLLEGIPEAFRAIADDLDNK